MENEMMNASEIWCLPVDDALLGAVQGGAAKKAPAKATKKPTARVKKGAAQATKKLSVAGGKAKSAKPVPVPKKSLGNAVKQQADSQARKGLNGLLASGKMNEKNQKQLSSLANQKGSFLSKADKARVGGTLQKGDGYYQVANARVKATYANAAAMKKDGKFDNKVNAEMGRLQKENGFANTLANKGVPHDKGTKDFELY